MNIAVLLKQVPSTESYIGISDDGVSVQTDNVKWVINPYDEFAVEEALRIRDAHGGAVTIVSVGTGKASEAIRTALAMGADKGILISDPAAENCDGSGVARILSTVLSSIEFDLVIAGQRAVDDDNFLVGAAVAEFLDMPHMSMVFKQEISGDRIQCHCTVDGGSAVIESPLPALFTTQRGLNEPRYVSLPGIMKAKRKSIDIKTLGDIGLDADTIGRSKIKIVSVKFPPQRAACTMIQGDSDQAKAVELVKALHEQAKVL